MVEPPRPPHPQRINQTINFVCPKTPAERISKGVFPIGKQLSRNAAAYYEMITAGFHSPHVLRLHDGFDT